MSNLIPMKIGIIKRLRLWWNNYKKAVGERLKYLQDKDKE